MVLHHHLDRRKNIRGKINVDQVALRPDPLDSLRIVLDRDIDVDKNYLAFQIDILMKLVIAKRIED